MFQAYDVTSCDCNITCLFIVPKRKEKKNKISIKSEKIKEKENKNCPCPERLITRMWKAVEASIEKTRIEKNKKR